MMDVVKTSRLTGYLTQSIYWVVFVFYQIIWHLAIPLIFLRLFLRGQKQTGYLKNIPERFGFYKTKVPFQECIWIHAVSVGETRAAQSLVKELVLQGHKVLLTHMTVTGRQTGSEIFSEYLQSGAMVQMYLPYDFCWPVSNFYRFFKPTLGLIMETEVWPSLIQFAKFRKMPIALINGRLSKRSASRFLTAGLLSKTTFMGFNEVLAQTQIDVDNFHRLGINHCYVTGNLKFDHEIDEAQVLLGKEIRKTYLNQRPVVCAVSTREGEEELILKAWQDVDQSSHPLLIIVPRHPQRFDEVVEKISAAHFSVLRRTDFKEGAVYASDVVLGDSMGEMMTYVSMSDFVVMGGTLLKYGGQNLIEPCSLAKPIIQGPHTFNFAQASIDAKKSGASFDLGSYLSEDELINRLTATINLLLKDTKRLAEASQAALSFSETYHGATQKTLAILEPYLRK
ncbi:MAG: 3-deoxy-D-manno-octulosonic acid transferase [Betaproteobacteria bacterium]